MMSDQSNYYHSHSKLNFIGPEGQLKLSEAKILVIGAGGLGCPCLQYLAGCGAGIIGIADFDTVAVSNLHRQTLYRFNDVGQPKTSAAKAALLLQNPYISVNKHPILVDEGNILELITPYDVIVDGTDNFAVRYLINDACVYLHKPLVYGAIYKTEGHVTVFNYRNSAMLRCLFPEPEVETYVPSCAEVGAYNIITGIIGMMMANEAVKIILNNPDVLADKLVTYDALAVKMQVIKYHEDKESRAISKQRFEKLAVEIDISPEDFVKLQMGSYHLIDVREEHEHEEFNIGGALIPLAKLKRYDFSRYSPSDMLILYCMQGLRSYSAAQYLREKGFINAINLRGGLNAYLKIST